MKLKSDIFIYLLVIFFVGCTRQKAEQYPTSRTVVCGKIQHLEVYPSTTEIFAEIKDFRDRKTIVKDSIRNDGTFKIIFDLYDRQDIQMRPLLDRLILHPGDSLFILLDFSDIGNVQFSGDRAASNQALRQYFWSNAGNVSFYSSDKLTPEAYRLYCDSIRDDAIKSQHAYLQKVQPPNEVAQWISDYIAINYFKSLLSYPTQYFRGDLDAFNAFIRSSAYFNFADRIDRTFSDFGNTIVNTDIYKLLESYEPYYIQRIWIERNQQAYFTLLDVNKLLLENKDNGVMQQMVLANFHYQLLSSNYVELFDSSEARLNTLIQAPFIRKPLFDYYHSVKKNIEHPEFASNAILSKMGVKGKALLDSIIAENKGKVLFVDLWATWCGPCIKGMEASKEIIPRYENKEIEFIFLCVGSTEKNWETSLSTLKIGGKHYFCNKDQSRDIQNTLGVEGIPHYLIINKQGHIVEPHCHGLENQTTLNKIEALLME
jgi:thiol-disulfide isomerase/thioredoxin